MNKFTGNAGIGCISDTDPQPLLVRSHLGLFAIATVGRINNEDKLVEEAFSGPGHQFMAMSSGKINTTELTAALINQKNEMLDKGVPDKIQLTIARRYLPMLKLSDEWVGLDSLGGKTLPKGTLGEFDGMTVKPMTNAKMPANVPWMMTYKGSIIAPWKINKFKAHVDPPGLNGDLLEFRMIHDAFVIGKKADGVSVAVLPGFVTAAPTISLSGDTATVTAAGANIFYTTDGSDPRYSVDAKAYTAAVKLADGETIRAYAVADGKYSSAVAEQTYVKG